MNAEIISRLADSLDGKGEGAALSINIDLSSIGEAELQAKLAILAAHVEAMKLGA
jgi:hypothetical protein